MTLIMCLDQRGGMLFNNRRQTIDYELVELICDIGKQKLCISPFSEKYFEGKDFVLLDEPLKEAPFGAVVFIENENPTPYLERFNKIIIYRWNKVYPADRHFNTEPSEAGFRLAGKIKFSTEVHKDIVKEIYKR